MAETKTHKATKRAGGRRKAGGAKRTTGRIQVRRDTAEYRAAGQEQASRIRGEIDAALADARRTREEIEARIEGQWHNRAPTAAGGNRGRK
jgi:regulator of protease activity HflC (stomatin/prohibitin superfamily)